MRLRDGTEVNDLRLDRLVQFDARSRAYAIRPLVDALKPQVRSYTWGLHAPWRLDQGADGACVGFAITNELLSLPARRQFGSQYAATRFAVEDVYFAAQRRDPWPGGAYPGAHPFYEGTSVLAGLQVIRQLGYCREFRWAFSLEEAVEGVSVWGPAILGVDWYSSMMHPSASGFIRPIGEVVGGHAILWRGVKLVWRENRYFPWRRTWKDIDLERSYAILTNSWGSKWGDNGDVKMSLVDLASLLRQDGECAFLVDRTYQ